MLKFLQNFQSHFQRTRLFYLHLYALRNFAGMKDRLIGSLPAPTSTFVGKHYSLGPGQSNL